MIFKVSLYASYYSIQKTYLDTSENYISCDWSTTPMWVLLHYTMIPKLKDFGSFLFILI